ncbi:SGNH/GDSL hydrolase family protein [Paracoccaceae bacterium GXU_MW_L88]
MAIVVLGGSNSLYQNGWVSHLSEKTDQEVRNLSVGASSSLAALYRFLGDNGPTSGDLVVWEYAINDLNHHLISDYSYDLLMHNVEHLIRLCRERGCPLVPVIMTAREQEVSKSRDPYYERLASLFDAYGLSSFDVSQAYRKSIWPWRRRGMGRDAYSDAAHYKRDPKIMKFVVQGFLKAMETATVPAKIEPLYTGDATVRLLSEFPSGERFTNRVIDVPADPLPLKVASPVDGALIGVYYICYPANESGVVVSSGNADNSATFSTFRDGNFRRPLMKSLSIVNLRGEGLAVAAEAPISLTPITEPGKYYCEPEISAVINTPAEDPATKIAGLLFEIPAA